MTADDDPRNEALAAEHAAVWSYGVLAARTSSSANPALVALFTRAYRAHVGARDALLVALSKEKVAPAIASPSYPLPARLDSPAALKAAAAAVEAHCCEVYAWLVSRSTGATRIAAITALEMGAVRELGLRGTPETFPGAAELADRIGLDTGP
ncbi:DUF4439 domain-containing protein [Nocardioides sp. Kera G14]|uniref:DUF4439 domain-containing protein n=1 Tax=Nocardioides sp. Kera G14 TaxID=2884264 RepID=UPI001D11CFFC|nr:DUF4439 domain-containing protein [Nocardioides sp. Kera G14]UDY22575.1 ferritin-like domain-containing protein [Nocardioides sp. Kera G14]